ncbi:50S ribosomal protein L10 [Hyphomicrobium sp.]|uniref:50S ribosomal protein L10 n=1 Tax=Hyphomicrobium sp. TaxID=82 RepID=UPI002D778301|nr:50S ribosomal protein L10 [Hyphomicrobium sp.]HET6390570.1 50S ribosomal protein L10 [Hyphomicrobium sp.]
MDRAAKRELIDYLHAELKSTGVVVVAHNTGMVAAQSAELRRRVKEAGGSVKVAKNKLAQLALKDTDAEKLSDLLKGPTVLAFSTDPIAAAKATVAYAKGNDKLVILGGAMGKTILDAKGVQALADLPSLDELRAKIIGLLNAPATKIARTVKEPGAKLARVIQAKASKEEAAA